MSLLPDTDRILLGPGPSLTAPRVMRAMAAPTRQPSRSADDGAARRRARAAGRGVPRRRRFVRVRRVRHRHVGHGDGRRQPGAAKARARPSSSPAISAIASRRCASATARRSRGSTSSGAAPAIPTRCGRQLKATPADVVAMVHAETSTGVLNPVRELAAIAREHGALTIVDAVTSLGGMPLDVGAWGIDAVYSCTQKCLGGPSGLAPVVFGPRALDAAREVPQLLLRSRRCSRTTGCAASITTRCRRRWSTRCTRRCAIVEEEGLDARWARHERNHRALLESLAELGLSRAAARRRAAVDAERGARARRRRRSGGAHAPARRRSTSRSAPGSVRWPARSGASA